MKIYQCLRCGLTFKSKKQVVSHLQYVEKVDPFTLEYYFQSFSVKEAKGVV